MDTEFKKGDVVRLREKLDRGKTVPYKVVKVDKRNRLNIKYHIEHIKDKEISLNADEDTLVLCEGYELYNKINRMS